MEININKNNKFNIYVYGKKILIKTNQNNILDGIKKYFEGYILDKSNNKIDFCIYILINKELYKDGKMQYLCEKKYFNDKIYYILFKKCLININMQRKRLVIILEKYDEDFLDDINRIILNLLHKLLESTGIVFMEAAGVAVNRETTVLLGEKNLIKDIVYFLLKTKYNYIGVEDIGLKEIDGEVCVFNLPEKTKMRETYKKKIVLNTNLKKIMILENNLNIEENKISIVKEKELIQIFRLKHENSKKKTIDFFNKIFDINADKELERNYKKLLKNIETIKIEYNKYNVPKICKDLINLIS